MQSPKLPTNERLRLSVLSEYQLLDTLPEEDYDNVTSLVASICDAPMSLITMLDKERNFFKSHHGVPFQESPRDISFCGHAILGDGPIFIIQDARLDERFVNNPLIEGAKAIFYAGVPLVNPEGYALGTLCVFDHKPRILTDSQKHALITLGKQVVNSLELRRQNLKLQAAKNELTLHNIQLKKFASHVSHDLKSPLANIISLSQLLKEDLEGKHSDSSLEYLEYIEDSALILKDYIDGILLHYKADELIKEEKEDVQLSKLSEDISQLLLSKNDTLSYTGQDVIKNINKVALTQILINLVDNALKYNDSEKRLIEIAYVEESKFHKFLVSDNGIGIEKDKQDLIFNLFAIIPHDNIKRSTGIGLSTIKNLIDKLGGAIQVTSEVGVGSVFTFKIAK
ncbi:GAF domain-containing sensor histidine kinase [Gelidibacter sp.]|uniref:sensor histidine kinase n=1 Tax=Gelidibacter sp. TaxID=2018083 RepID=UPI002C4C410E|nr:GAF domain-containing sensor histidine kinase [Gelidibacter sp.]HUH26716.1 GAF domain-containing sensor histidine kinase [Gelidibacter sp.]